MIDPQFELEHLGRKLSVQTKEIHGRVIFKVSFPNGTTPIVITRASDFAGQKFWTSIPEGRQKEAEDIGPLIEQYHRAKQS